MMQITALLALGKPLCMRFFVPFDTNSDLSSKYVGQVAFAHEGRYFFCFLNQILCEGEMFYEV